MIPWLAVNHRERAATNELSEAFYAKELPESFSVHKTVPQLSLVKNTLLVLLTPECLWKRGSKLLVWLAFDKPLLNLLLFLVTILFWIMLLSLVGAERTKLLATKLHFLSDTQQEYSEFLHSRDLAAVLCAKLKECKSHKSWCWSICT